MKYNRNLSLSQMVVNFQKALNGRTDLLYPMQKRIVLGMSVFFMVKNRDLNRAKDELNILIQDDLSNVEFKQRLRPLILQEPCDQRTKEGLVDVVLLFRKIFNRDPNLYYRESFSPILDQGKKFWGDEKVFLEEYMEISKCMLAGHIQEMINLIDTELQQSSDLGFSCYPA